MHSGLSRSALCGGRPGFAVLGSAVPPIEGGIATMIVTITRAQRDALYEEMLSDLTGVGDIYLALNNRDDEAARRLWQRFEAELRLLDQLGWSPVEPLDRFEIDLPQEVLVRALATGRNAPSTRSASTSTGHRRAWPSPSADCKCSERAEARSPSSPMPRRVTGHEARRFGWPGQRPDPLRTKRN